MTRARHRYGMFHLRNDRWRLLGWMALCVGFVEVVLFLAGYTDVGLAGLRYLGALLIGTAVAAVLSKAFAISFQLLALAVWTFSFAVLGYLVGVQEITPVRNWTWFRAITRGFEEIVGLKYHSTFSIYRIPDFNVYEFLNLILLSVFFPLLVWFLALITERIGSQRSDKKDGSGSNLREATHAVVNNATFANAAGWTAILFPIAFLLLMVLAHNIEPLPAEVYASGFWWFTIVAPIVYFGLAVQRALPELPLPEQAIRLNAVDEAPSLRDLYDALADMPGQISQEWLENGGSRLSDADLADRRKADVDALLAGGTLHHFGNLDLEFFRLVSEAISKVEDTAHATIVLCPDSSGAAVAKHLRAQGRFDFPDIMRRIAVWSAADGDQVVAAAHRMLDVIVIEESVLSLTLPRFLALNQNEFLLNFFRRLGLLVIVDFHCLDASLLVLALHQIDRTQVAEKVGLLVQMRRRRSDTNQILAIRGALTPKKSSRKATETQTASPGVTMGRLWLVGSEGSRQELAKRLGYPSAPIDHRTQAYFGLVPREAAQKSRNVAIFVLSGNHEPHAFDALRTALRNRSPHGSPKPFRRHETGPCYVPSTDIRICVIPDTGNILDCLDVSYAFFGGSHDYLTFVVGEGYSGRRYLVDRYKVVDRSLLMPMAQEPGIGITDVANSLAILMSRPEGVCEDDVTRLLNLASGNVRTFIDISSTKRGLERLFGIFEPGSVRSIDYRLDAMQRTVFQYRGGSGAAIAEPTVRIQTQGGELLAEVPLADEGLLFCVDHVFRIGGRRLNIERIDRAGSAIYAKVADNNDDTLRPFARHFFERAYAIDLGAVASRVAFIGEGGDKAMQFGLWCRCVHVHIGIRRRSTGLWSISSDDEPTPLSDGNYTRLSPPITTRRPFRSVAFIAFEDPQESYRADAVLCATLAASLQVVLGLSFPALRQRLVVVSLDGTAPTGRLKNAAFRCLFPTGEMMGGSVTDVLTRLYEIESGTGDPPIVPLVGFAVIEDSAHDIGVARRIHEELEHVIQRWRSFLGWAATQEDWNIDGLLNAKEAFEFPGLVRTPGAGALGITPTLKDRV